MYNNSTKGQLNKKARRHDDKMSCVPVILTLSEANGEGSHYPSVRHAERSEASHNPYNMSLRGRTAPFRLGNTLILSMSLRGDFVPFRMAETYILKACHCGGFCVGRSNEVAKSRSVDCSADDKPAEAQEAPAIVKQNQRQERSTTGTERRGNLFDLLPFGKNLFWTLSVPFLLAQKKRHQRKHVRVFCPKIHKHGLFYKPSVCVRSTDTTRRTEVALC